jgi:uncharacterized protein (TIGR03435 family)
MMTTPNSIRPCFRILPIAIACLSLSLSICKTNSAFAQAAVPTPAKVSSGVQQPAFDVISIRPHDPKITGPQWGVYPDRYVSFNMPLAAALLKTFLPDMLVDKSRLSGAPSWVWNENYDIVGKVAPQDIPEWQKQLKESHKYPLKPNPFLAAMLQTALVERCNLSAHFVLREGHGYELTVGKNGPKLKLSQPGAPAPSGSVALSDGGAEVPSQRGADHPTVTFYHTSMGAFAEALTILIGEPVTDKTGLTGSYDFSLSRDKEEPTSWYITDLGLKLQRVNIPVQTMVIDHIEKPTPN